MPHGDGVAAVGDAVLVQLWLDLLPVEVEEAHRDARPDCDALWGALTPFPLQDRWRRERLILLIETRASTVPLCASPQPSRRLGLSVLIYRRRFPRRSLVAGRPSARRAQTSDCRVFQAGPSLRTPHAVASDVVPAARPHACLSSDGVMQGSSAACRVGCRWRDRQAAEQLPVPVHECPML